MNSTAESLQLNLSNHASVK